MHSTRKVKRIKRNQKHTFPMKVPGRVEPRVLLAVVLCFVVTLYFWSTWGSTSAVVHADTNPTQAPDKPISIAEPKQDPKEDKDKGTSTQPANPIPQPQQQGTRLYTYKVVKTFPHDPSSFTQGLELFNGHLYEGTGLNGQSQLLLVDMQTGKALKSYRLARSYFGEGITVFKEKIYQLTWTSKIGFIYDRESFRQVGTWGYQHEGWGLTHDDRYLIVSDGTDVIRFWDPEAEAAAAEGEGQGQSFNVVKEIKVKYADGRPARKLNELEWISGEIWANVWQDDKIIIINPETGVVRGIVDLTGLRETNSGRSPRDDVLNGIAYNKDTGEVYVTGKRWSYIYQIQLVANKGP